MPVRKLTQEETEKIFGSGVAIFGAKRPTSSAQNSDSEERPTSASPAPLPDLQNLPEDPISGVERILQDRSKGQSTTDDPAG